MEAVVTNTADLQKNQTIRSAKVASNFLEWVYVCIFGRASGSKNIMMQAVVLTERGKIELTSVPVPEPKENEALVKIFAAALNRRDYFITQNLYPLIEVFSLDS
jgi:hypothetical protein